jgi:spermidine dehydrogenase
LTAGLIGALLQARGGPWHARPGFLFSYPGKPIGEQVSLGREELLKTPFREYERRIREQLAMVFGTAGFNPNTDIAGIILNRWGHAYLSPQPKILLRQRRHPGPGRSAAPEPGEPGRIRKFGM